MPRKPAVKDGASNDVRNIPPIPVDDSPIIAKRKSPSAQQNSPAEVIFTLESAIKCVIRSKRLFVLITL